MLFTIAFAWLEVIPIFELLTKISDACWVVIPTLSLFETISLSCTLVIPTFSVFKATAELLDTKLGKFVSVG